MKKGRLSPSAPSNSDAEVEGPNYAAQRGGTGCPRRSARGGTITHTKVRIFIWPPDDDREATDELLAGGTDVPDREGEAPDGSAAQRREVPHAGGRQRRSDRRAMVGAIAKNERAKTTGLLVRSIAAGCADSGPIERAPRHVTDCTHDSFVPTALGFPAALNATVA